ncbi:MAG: signal peptide peptidase SppA [Myxococcales bacterium]|nr:MAG: signal peptide peptidase SppA [Myxococcales bacterium]
MMVECQNCQHTFRWQKPMQGDAPFSIDCAACGFRFSVDEDGQTYKKQAHPWILRKQNGQNELISTFGQLLQRIENGEISGDDEISRSGKRWKKLRQIEGLSNLFVAESRQQNLDLQPQTPASSEQNRVRHATMVGMPSSIPPPSAIASSAKKTMVGVPVQTPAKQPQKAKPIGSRTVLGTLPLAQKASADREKPPWQNSPIGENQSPLPLDEGSLHYSETTLRSPMAPELAISASLIRWRWWIVGGMGAIMMLASLVLIAAMLSGCGYVKSSQEEDPALEQKTLVELKLSQAPIEFPYRDPLSEDAIPLRKVLGHLNHIQQRNAGLFLELSPLSGTWARSQELKRTLVELRKSGKTVHCHIHNADNLSIAVASMGCDRISATPGALINLVGVALQVSYLKNLLSKIGLSAELLQVGRFKGAADPFTRDSMPEEVRQSLNQLADDLHAELVASLVDGRKLNAKQAQDIINNGPYSAEAALKLGLIDAVSFKDEARQQAKNASHALHVQVLEETEDPEKVDLGKLFEKLTEEPENEVEGNRVALVVLSGTIAESENESVNGIHSGPVQRMLRKIRDNHEIKAVVVRINSPGGSALASDLIWKSLRDLGKKKPLIISIGDMAASGGYYIASAGDTVFAEQTSIVGSIGVVGGKVSAADLAKRLGVHTEIIKRGNHGAWMSPAQPFSADERKTILSLMEQTYELFLKRITAGRGLSEKQLQPAAEGRIMVGTRARSAGLVDEIGGLEEALALAKSKGGLNPAAPVQAWPPPKTLLAVISETLGVHSSISTKQLMALSKTIGKQLELERSLDWYSLLQTSQQPVLTVLPFQVQAQ